MIHEKQQYEKVKLKVVPRYFRGLEIVAGVFGAGYSEDKGPDWEKKLGSYYLWEHTCIDKH